MSPPEDTRSKAPAGGNDIKLVRQTLERQNRNLSGDRAQIFQHLTLVDLIGSAKGLYGPPDDVQSARDELRGEWP